MIITVAVLTYRRPHEIAAGLPLILDQVRDVAIWSKGEHRANLVVIDNDAAGSARAVVATFAAADLRYVVEPTAGVSAARNRALDEARASDLLAFIDDDERPHPGWMELLVRTQQEHDSAGVAGRVVAEFDGAIDPWIDAGKFFVRRSLPTGTDVTAAGAGNLLLDLRQIRQIGLRFDEAFGLSGGEDTLFTRMMTDGGHRLVWCDEAVVTDRVPIDRMSRRWVLARSLSHGNTAALIDLRLSPQIGTLLVSRLRVGGKGAARVGGGAVRFIYGVVRNSDVHQARGLRACWRGVGMIAGGLGLVFQEYARVPDSGPMRRLRRFGGSPSRDTASEGAPSPITVLLSFPATPPKGNPYRVLLERSLVDTPGVRKLNFSWRTAFVGRYDVFHVHWPEILLSGKTPLRRAVKQAMFAALLVKLWVSATAIVRTVHNLALPNGISRREIFLLKWADRQTSVRIRLNDSTAIPAGQIFETIPHGHYQDWFADYPADRAVPGRMAFIGLIRRYKGVDHLIKAFQETDDDALSLVVLGQPSTDELSQSLRRLAAGDCRIQLSLEFASDVELVRVVTEAELIVLPYREMHNSAGVLTALSLGRPVLVPRNVVNHRLADEVGTGWVHTYSGQLTGAHLTNALQLIRTNVDRTGPDLSARGWDQAGLDHANAYRRAAELVSAKRYQ